MNKAVALLVIVMGCSAQSGVAIDSEWHEHASMAVARSEHPAVVRGDEIVVIGGLVETAPGRFGVTRSVEAYDPDDDSWRPLPDLPEPRHHAMAAMVGDRLFVIGGFSETGRGDVVSVWELVGDHWEDRARLPAPIGAGAAVVIGDEVFLVGGATGGGLFRYTPGDDVWAELAPPLTSREHLAAVALDGEIWALAGRWQGDIFATTEIYDPETDTWREGPSMGQARSGFGAAVAEGEIIVAGGELLGPDEALNSVERLSRGGWVDDEPLPFGLHGNPLVVFGPQVFLPGGSTRAAAVDNPGTMLSLTVGG
jgi:N-acetylneuraminic acid mutarotase